MKGLFVSNKIAKKLKELMFDEPCLAYYSGNDLEDDTLYTYTNFYISTSVHKNSVEGTNKNHTFSAPLWQQVIDWLREKHKISITIDTDRFGRCFGHLNNLESGACYWTNDQRNPMDYNEAREIAVNNAINTIDDKFKNKREQAMNWWNSLSSLHKTQICDTNTDLLKCIRRWETLTGREIEMLFNKEKI